jgi:hypothetical protein
MLTRRLSMVFSITAFACFACPVLLVEATECDPVLTEPGETEEYPYMFRENRCEGFYRAENAAAGLDLIGYTGGLIAYELDSAEIITVKPVASPFIEGEDVNVRAEPFPLRTYYRMDTVVAPGSELEWPVGDVLEKKGLDADKIGVVGWVKSSGHDKTYVPVRLTWRQRDESNDTQLRLFYRSNISLEYFSFDLQCTGDYKYVDRKQETHRAGRPIVLEVPDEAKGECQARVFALRDEGDPNRIDDWLKCSSTLHVPDEVQE